MLEQEEAKRTRHVDLRMLLLLLCLLLIPMAGYGMLRRITGRLSGGLISAGRLIRTCSQRLCSTIGDRAGSAACMWCFGLGPPRRENGSSITREMGCSAT